MTKIIIIYGPTTTGKTAFALQLANKFGGEIISADSRQVYKGLDIGTGKVSFESEVENYSGYWIVDGIKIHGFDLVNPGDPFTVADFLKFAVSSMVQTIELEKLPIIVGGTGFYIKALIDGIDTVGIGPDTKLRAKLEKLSKDELYKKLLEMDPVRAKSMNQSDRANPRRLIRAIEIVLASTSEESEPTSEVTSYPLPTTSYQFVGLTAPNNYLYSRADAWLETRLNHGLIEEVEGLIKQDVDVVWLDSLGLEYRWLTRFLVGKLNYQSAIERLKGDIHNFIRRQKTWFKQLRGISLFDISKSNWQKELEGKIKSSTSGESGPTPEVTVQAPRG